MTQSRGVEEIVAGSPSSFGEHFRNRYRCRSNTSGTSDENSNSLLFDIDESESSESCSTAPISPNSDISSCNNISIPMQINHKKDHGYHSNSLLSNSMSSSHSPIQSLSRGNRIRGESYCLDSAFTSDEAVNFFNSRNTNKPRASCVLAEKNYMLSSQLYDLDEDEDEGYYNLHRMDSFEEEDSILGRIHLELCKYHEMGRFLVNENDDFNEEAAFFHLKQ